MQKTIKRLGAVIILSAGLTLQTGAQDMTFSSDSLLLGTEAVATVGSASLYKVPALNITNTVSGLLGGLTSLQGSGVPGDDMAKLYIRGIGTYGMNGAANTAKIFVDGFEVNSTFFNNLSPSEIKSVTILKDAAALSVFGMNGAEGVIWVETNHGSSGDLQVTYQVRSGFQNPVNVTKPLGTSGYTRLYNQALSNDANTGDLDFYYDDEYVGPDVDWWDEVIGRKGLMVDTDLSFHGGSENINYYVVLGYSDQQGLFDVKNSDSSSNLDFNRYSIRTSVDVKLTKFFSFAVDMSGRVQEKTRPNYLTGDLMNNIAAYPANAYPVYDDSVEGEMDNFSGTMVYPDNPVASIKGLGWVKDHTRVIQSNFKFKEDFGSIVPGLYLQEGISFYVNSTGRYSKTRNYARYSGGVPQTTDQNTSMTASSFNARNMEQWIQGYGMIAYDMIFNRSRLSANLGMRISNYMGEGKFQYMNHYVNQTGSVRYSFDDRYILGASYSYFGSDAYSESGRWQFYPSVSAAWVLSNENFLKSVGSIDMLKVRASAGLAGNTRSAATQVLSSYSSDGRYLYEQYYVSSTAGSFYLGNSAPFSSQGTLAPLFFANSGVGPERSLKFNIGLDARLWHCLDITLDAFQDKRSGILTKDNSIMQYFGNITQFNNVGRMTNMGAEATINFSRRSGDFFYSIFGIAGFARNVVDYMAEAPTAYDYNAQSGRPYGSRIGLKCLGFFGVDDFDDEGNLNEGIPVPMFGRVQPGDLRYEDLDGDGQVDQTDVTFIGNPSYPMLNFSFGGSLEFRGFDFSFLFTGAAGATVDLNEFPTYSHAFVNNGNVFPMAQNAWAFYPDAGIDTRAYADYPRLTTNENNNNYRTSSFWIKDNNFIRLRNVEVGYDFSRIFHPGSIFSNARVYVNAMNPFTLSSVLENYEMDPECGFGYPALKSYNLGVQLNF